ncbi:MAG: acyl-CoA dehydrogenase [Micavibrio sp.]|nr:acyl-CoA dehydrogenase [Micavibrio sp.]|tara:strand:- start:1665 stop:3290 length:1626 start_codon:yes stop_codon:yes gene_type:complete
MPYTAPIKDQLLALRALGFDFSLLDEATVEAILDEANKLASNVLAPLNWTGDQEGLKRADDGSIKMPKGFKDAYQQYRESGWNAVPFSEEYGGQNLPWAMAFPIQEMWQAANMAFGLCPLLNQGAVEAILHHGSDEQKEIYLPKLISGEWTGTMNLTEPQAGSDLAAVKSRAEPQADGSYKISGQKIFITYGEHDMADNIIHLVLARTPNAPEGVKGISLFIVPKILEDGSRNDLVCSGIEHKLGIHASPTCTMQFGDKGGATGYLIGEENKGLIYMFTMMNNARLSVGLQGVAISDRAYQHAFAFAKERVQGGGKTIDQHTDVQRMLKTMNVLTEAGRALTYEAAIAFDAANAGDKTAQSKVEFLTPIVKAFGTDNAIEVTSLGIQVHGGMGYVEETGAAQYLRDARILPIYEGTNGIQAIDLVGRKTLMNDGAYAKTYIEELKSHAADTLVSYIKRLEETLEHVLSLKENPDKAQFIAHAYLNQFALVAGGVLLKRLAETAASDDDKDFAHEKMASFDFYCDMILPRAESFARQILAIK